MRLSANGGTPELVVRADEGEQMCGPQLLPDGDSSAVQRHEGNGTEPLGPGASESCGHCPQGSEQSSCKGKRCPLSFDRGHVVYALRDGLFGICLRCETPESRGRRGAARSRRAAVQWAWSGAGSNYAVSDRGTLVYVTGGTSLRSFVWMNRNGTGGWTASARFRRNLRGAAPVARRRSRIGDAQRRHLDLRRGNGPK